MILSQAPRNATLRRPNVCKMFEYSPPGARPRGVERNTMYGTEVASTTGAKARYPSTTLDPVRSHASVVTRKMPAPTRIPTSVAYDSSVPRSRRSQPLRPAFMNAPRALRPRLFLAHPGARGAQFHRQLRLLPPGLRPPLRAIPTWT